MPPIKKVHFGLYGNSAYIKAKFQNLNVDIKCQDTSVQPYVFSGKASNEPFQTWMDGLTLDNTPLLLFSLFSFYMHKTHNLTEFCCPLWHDCHVESRSNSLLWVAPHDFSKSSGKIRKKTSLNIF